MLCILLVKSNKKRDKHANGWFESAEIFVRKALELQRIAPSLSFFRSVERCDKRLFRSDVALYFFGWSSSPLPTQLLLPLSFWCEKGVSHSWLTQNFQRFNGRRKTNLLQTLSKTHWCCVIRTSYILSPNTMHPHNTGVHISLSVAGHCLLWNRINHNYRQDPK